MSYKKFIDLFKTKCDSYKGSMYFGIGTMKQLNELKNLDFPLVWIVTPMNKATIKNANSIIVEEKFKFTMKVMQGATLNTPQCDIDQLYDETNKVTIAFLNELLKNKFVIDVGESVQKFRQADAILVGWDTPIQLTNDIDMDLCCSLFNE